MLFIMDEISIFEILIFKILLYSTNLFLSF